jgi:fatty acid desaturase
MYGTPHDGEYYPFEYRSRQEFWLYLAQPLFAPVLGVLRFYVLTPLTWFSSPLQRLIHQRASSLVMNPAYLRPVPSPQDSRSMRIQEIQCFNWCIIVTVILVCFVRQWAWGLLLNAYLMGVAVVILNHLRTLGAHRWTNNEEEMTYVAQVLDSANYSRWPLLAELWAPVGTRFHALHHLFPALPYHNLPAAHRRLMSQLPADSPYRQTEVPSLLGALWDVWKRSGSHVAERKRLAERNKKVDLASR